ncbi:MAG: hypothetical protein ING16_17925 [Roseomonas sp.]|jgi:hypothetical protein|nr:hypothetical protein [Roseomonas sp.]
METTATPSALDFLDGADIDPQTLAILKLAMSRGQTPATSEEVDEQRERLERLAGANRNLLRMMDKLAGAIGACQECWGADPDCSTCNGEGHPGFFPPDRLAFEAFVLPVVRAMSARIASAQRRPSAPLGTWVPNFTLQRNTKEN